jgi:subtilisin family serine protease
MFITFFIIFIFSQSGNSSTINKKSIIYEFSNNSNFSYLNDDGLPNPKGKVYLTIELKENTLYSRENTNLYNTKNGDYDQQLKLLRESTKTYFQIYNNDFINNYNFKFYERKSISFYAPYIQFEYSDYNNLMKDKSNIDDLLQNYLVSNVYISDEYLYNYTTRNDFLYLNKSTSNYDFSKALNDVGLSNMKQQTGEGINIGILELGILDDYTNFQIDKVQTYGYTKDAHTTQVMSILGGKSGIASNANLFSASYLDYSLYNCMNWLISKNVHVINMSAGVFNSKYTSTSSYIDYIVKTNKISFIAAAGNREKILNAPFGISSPSTGLNVFSIGSYDVNKSVSYFSGAWDDPYQGRILKPTLVAPGGNLIGIDNIPDKLAGTSFSAPIVTGIVALLMERYNTLKLHPEMVMSIITASTKKLPTQTNTWDSDAGFGSVNYLNTFDAYEHTTMYQINSNVLPDSLVQTTNLIVPANNSIKIVNFALYNSYTSNIADDPNRELPFEFSKYIIKIYNGTTLLSSSTSISNINFLEYTNYSSSEINLTIKVFLSGSKIGNDIEYASLSISGIHTHSYEEKWIDNFYHLSSCWCGYQVQVQHMFEYTIYYDRHIGTCSCGYTFSGPHDFEQVIGFSIDNSESPMWIPKFRCRVCGYISYEL